METYIIVETLNGNLQLKKVIDNKIKISSTSNILEEIYFKNDNEAKKYFNKIVKENK